MQITVRLLKPAKDRVITYQGTLLHRSTNQMVIRARWEMDTLDLGYVVFAHGDELDEYYYGDRWYNIYQLHAPEGQLKGWYCNITRPAIFHQDSIESEDLDLDLFVSPDRQTVLLLDDDEYAAHGLETRDPEAHAQVQAAVAELRAMARRGVAPFDAPDTYL